MSGLSEDRMAARGRPGRRRRLAAAAAAASAAIAIGLWLAYPPALAGIAARFAGEAAVPAPDKARGVRVATVRLTDQWLEKRFTGVVAARYETPVAFRIAGKIATREIEIGQAVRRGDVLMTLDPADHEAALRAAEANLAAAYAQKTQAVAEEGRQARLLRQGWTTQAAHDRILAAARAAEEQAKAAAEQVELARSALGYARLTAPEDGIVTAIRAEAGQVAPQGQPVLTLVRPGHREAVVAVPEGQIRDLGDWTAQADFWSRGDADTPSRPDTPAVLREIAPQADPLSRTHAARFSLPNDEARAELGATAIVTLRRRTDERAAALPSTAVFFKNGAAMVWRVAPSGDRVEAIPVAVLRLAAERSVVTGIEDGDRVVTLGVHRLDAGTVVRVVEDLGFAGARR